VNRKQSYTAKFSKQIQLTTELIYTADV